METLYSRRTIVAEIDMLEGHPEAYGEIRSEMAEGAKKHMGDLKQIY